MKKIEAIHCTVRDSSSESPTSHFHLWHVAFAVYKIVPFITSRSINTPRLKCLVVRLLRTKTRCNVQHRQRRVSSESPPGSTMSVLYRWGMERMARDPLLTSNDRLVAFDSMAADRFLLWANWTPSLHVPCNNRRPEIIFHRFMHNTQCRRLSFTHVVL